MAETITMPDLGFEAGGGELTVWLKAVGDPIQAGEPIAEFESDKVTLEVESPAAGILLEQIVQPGQAASVGAPLARVGAAHELPRADARAPAPTPAMEAAPPPAAEAAPPPAWPAAAEPAPDPAQREGVEAAHPPGDGILATPIALRMAREHNLDLGRVPASGPGGRIVRGDVENYLARSPAAETAAPDAPPAARPRDADDLPAPPPSPLRRTIAARMSQSKRTIPHFYITNSVIMDDALALRKQINDALPPQEQVTVNDLVMKAAALALRAFPNLNASYVDDRIVRHPEIHIGAAVAVDGGVLTVVNRQTDRRALSEIARANRALIERARAGKARPEDVAGGTFTISNLGGYDTDHFAAIINPPQAAILGVATAKQAAVVLDGQVVARAVMQITISADHRVTDGAECALFLQRVKGLLETPIQIVVS